MTSRARVVVGLALVAAVPSAAADRYEASIALRPHGGTAWVSEDGAAAARVPGVGCAVRATYGVRDWLALEAELGGVALGQARYEDVMVSIDGAPAQPQTITRTTHTTRLAVGVNARLGVAWVPTVGIGVGAQPTFRGDALIEGAGLVPDERASAVEIRPLVFARVGLDRRLSARWVVGVDVRAAHDGSIGTLDVGIALARYWYPSW